MLARSYLQAVNEIYCKMLTLQGFSMNSKREGKLDSEEIAAL